MKSLITTLIISLAIFSGCGELNDDEKYITKLTIGDTLNVAINDLVVKESNEHMTKYYFGYYKGWSGVGRKYYITVDKKNIVKAIWTKRY